MSMVNMKPWRRRLTLIFGAFLTATAADAADLCQEFQAALSKPTGLTEFAVEGTYDESQDGERRLRHIDLDSDGIDEEVTWFDPEAGSRIPADPNTLHVKPSSTVAAYTFEEQGLYVIRYQSKFYVVSGHLLDERGPLYVNIHQLTSTGARLVCAYECKGSECLPRAAQ
jgi:hypothetical protein